MFIKTMLMCCVVVFFRSGEKIFVSTIINGILANITDFPYAAFLNLHCVGFKKPFGCGATIISPRIFLTAAHCTYCEIDYGPIIVFIGNANTETNEGIYIDKVERYPKFQYRKSAFIFYDIALLYVDTDLPLGPNVQPVQLSTKGMEFEEGVLAGWGSTNLGNRIASDNLTYMPGVKVIPSDECIKKHGFKGTGEGGGTFCAGQLEGTKYAYSGDSGSGLITRVNDTNYIVGVVISVRKQNLAIGVYTNVSIYRDWINETSTILLNSKSESDDDDGFFIDKK